MSKDIIILVSILVAVLIIAFCFNYLPLHPKEDDVYENVMTEDRIRIEKIEGDTVFYTEPEGYRWRETTKDKLKKNYNRIK